MVGLVWPIAVWICYFVVLSGFCGYCLLGLVVWLGFEVMVSCGRIAGLWICLGFSFVG